MYIKEVIEKIQEYLQESASQKSSFIERAEKIKAPTGNVIATDKVIESRQISINGIFIRLDMMIDLISSTLERIEDTDLIPRSYFDNLNTEVQKIPQKFQALQKVFTDAEAAGGIRDIEPDNFVIRSNQNNAAFNLASELNALDKIIDASLVSFYTLRNVLGDKAVLELKSVPKHFTEILNKVDGFHKEIKGLFSEAQKKVSSLNTKDENSSKSLENVNAILKKIQEVQTSANEEMAKITAVQNESAQKLPAVQQAHTEAAALKKQIDQYQADFKKFQESLDSRIKTYTEGNEELTTLTASLKEQEEKIIELNEKAADMLNNVTVAGLAKGFGDRRDELKTELKSAEGSYHKALWFLFISSLFPVIYVVYYIHKDKPFDHLNLMVFLLLIVPSALFIRFTGGRYNNLFRLREHYNHKYSVAVSVEGFRNHLDKGKEEIIASTFVQLSTSNPDDILEHGKGYSEHPFPLWEKFLSLFDHTIKPKA